MFRCRGFVFSALRTIRVSVFPVLCYVRGLRQIVLAGVVCRIARQMLARSARGQGNFRYGHFHKLPLMFRSNTKIKLDKALYDRLAEIAKAGGYSSTDELVVHILEREAAKFSDTDDDKEVEKQLRGLGYIE